MTRRGYSGPEFPDRRAVAGLTQRQNRERLEERQRVFLPLYRVPQVPDKRRAGG